jgi:hypothetical protein
MRVRRRNSGHLRRVPSHKVGRSSPHAGRPPRPWPSGGGWRLLLGGLLAGGRPRAGGQHGHGFPSWLPWAGVEHVPTRTPQRRGALLLEPGRGEAEVAQFHLPARVHAEMAGGDVVVGVLGALAGRLSREAPKRRCCMSASAALPAETAPVPSPTPRSTSWVWSQEVSRDERTWNELPNLQRTQPSRCRCRRRRWVRHLSRSA